MDSDCINSITQIWKNLLAVIEEDKKKSSVPSDQDLLNACVAFRAANPDLDCPPFEDLDAVCQFCNNWLKCKEDPCEIWRRLKELAHVEFDPTALGCDDEIRMVLSYLAFHDSDFSRLVQELRAHRKRRRWRREGLESDPDDQASPHTGKRQKLDLDVLPGSLDGVGMANYDVDSSGEECTSDAVFKCQKLDLQALPGCLDDLGFGTDDIDSSVVESDKDDSVFYRSLDSARQMESAANEAQNQKKWSEVEFFCRKASDSYIECDLSHLAADALAKAARYAWMSFYFLL
ncbi:OLC1v1025568C2 [Oldenlandia corymbosa var. corymbosa]|uniref:OLC1v1025568C2 n=1 Tax=Oldenlandia corymbosa var. corymbosa TaxID=529605 RepID=A0AAV1C5M5_OLDCO|nr:OLC1v1025568C2 [Oldenlandia corymbosa var. corymbosa]